MCPMAIMGCWFFFLSQKMAESLAKGQGMDFITVKILLDLGFYAD